MAMITQGAGADPAFLDGLRAAVINPALDPAFRAQVLGLPTEDDLAQSLFNAGTTPDPDASDPADPRPAAQGTPSPADCGRAVEPEWR